MAPAVLPQSLVLAQELGAIDKPDIEWSAITPVLLLIGGALLLLTVSALVPRRPPRSAYAIFTVVTCAAAVVASVLLWDRVQDPARGGYTAMVGALTVDGFSIFFSVLIAVSIALAALLADGYLRREGLEGPELYALMLLSGAGGVIMAMANDLIVVFLGLEILSIALYVMAGMHLRRTESQEAAIKYFVLGAFSSAFLLYGIALVYGATGSTNMSQIGAFLAGNVLESEGLLLLVVGSVLAVVQRDVKRMLAYSSINHAGFVLVAVEANTDRGIAGALFYLLAYAFMVVGSFAVVTLVGRRGDAAHDLDDYRGLSSERPVLALAFTVFLLSQAGVPLTSGFFAKFYVIGAAADARSYALAIIAMITAVVSAFLYLRIIVAMYFSGDEVDADAATGRSRIAVPWGAALSLGVAVAVTLVVGILPQALSDVARDAVPVLVSAGP
jgi:NADH:ubiquinone oxidoreductase subunit 2 (subunit N)